MDTFAEMAPAAGPDPMPMRPRTRAGQPAPNVAPTPPAWQRPGTSGPGRVSLDPLHATDRYRLVMPYDQRL
jgi:hypothetical protein